MKIDFRPQKLLSSMIFEEKIPNGIRRVIQIEGKHPKTIDMELSNLDTRGDVYPKEYYVSQYKVYNTRNSDLLKSMKKPEVVGTSNSTVEIYKRNMYGNYDSFKIVRNGSNIRRIDD